MCKARCATPHSEKERENRDSPLLAILDGESIPCQHDQKGSSCSKNQRRIFLKLLFFPAVHVAQGRNTIPSGSSHSYARTWLPSKGERKNSEQEALSSRAPHSFTAQAVPSGTAQPLRELTIAFTAQDPTCICLVKEELFNSKCSNISKPTDCEKRTLPQDSYLL